MRNTIVIAILLAGTMWIGVYPRAGSAVADDQKPPQTVLAVYDLRDYLQAIRDYPLYPPSAPASTTEPAALQMRPFASATGEPPVEDKQQELVDDLVKLVTSSVQPDSWRDAGGSIGSITEFGGKLYVAQTPDAQAQVKSLLADMAGDAKRSVRVSATWLLLDNGELSALRDPAGPGHDAITTISEPSLQKTKAFAHAELLCLNGQTVHIIGGAGAIRLQVHPILSAANGQVVLDALDEVGSERSASTTQPADSPDAADAGQQFHTTARIPLGENVVIGGITLQPAKELYLVVRVDAQ